MSENHNGTSAHRADTGPNRLVLDLLLKSSTPDQCIELFRQALIETAQTGSKEKDCLYYYDQLIHALDAKVIASATTYSAEHHGCAVDLSSEFLNDKTVRLLFLHFLYTKLPERRNTARRNGYTGIPATLYRERTPCLEELKLKILRDIALMWHN